MNRSASYAFLILSSLVEKIEPVRAYGEASSQTFRIASNSSSSYRYTVRTGPKISSIMDSELGSSVRMIVGSMK